jgi:NAD(P)-dependent dehydrogenase (short-subunit alcohol dehydrogenase family)
MLADIEAEALENAVEALRASQVRAEGVVADVTSRDSLRAAAAETIARFGKVHVVCNNAGVGAGGPIDQVKPGDWDWILAVNLMGVVYGMEVFTPHVRAHGEGGCFVNTASMAGMISVPGMEPYTATKYAVVGMSEGWAGQLAPDNINVAVLCPGFVKTKINQSGRTRQSQYGGPVPNNPIVGQSNVDNGIDPEFVGRRVLEAVQNDERYIFTHPGMRHMVEQRFDRIMAGFDAAAASPVLAGLDYATPVLPA